MAQIDPVTFEVVYHKATQVAEEAAEACIGVSASPIITEAHDIGVSICLPDGSSAISDPYGNTGFVTRSIKATIERCKDNPGIEEGDMFIMNDSWMSTRHQSDIAVVAPMHYKGELTGWTGCYVHHIDIGAITTGGWNTAAREIFHEGLQMPPVKLVEKGKLREDIFGWIMNTIRAPEISALDYKGQIASNNIARARMATLYDRYGLETVTEVLKGIIDKTESEFRSRLASMPDMVTRDVRYLEHDTIEMKTYRYVCTLTKKADTLKFDFTGTSPQSPGPVNAGPGNSIILVLLVRSKFAYDLPNNDGLFRPMTVIFPEGSLLNPRRPAPLSASVLSFFSAADACLSKLMFASGRFGTECTAPWNPLASNLVQLAGVDQRTGRSFGYTNVDQNGGMGCPARYVGDGVDTAGDAVNQPHCVNIETHELMSPVLFVYRRQMIDSGGPGKMRGGLGMEEAWMPYNAGRLNFTGFTHSALVPSGQGIFGGYPGSCHGYVLFKNTDLHAMFKEGKIPITPEQMKGERIDLPPFTDRLAMSPSDVLVTRFAAGGGFGDPIERDPELVVRDINDGHVSLECAESIYGVMVDGEAKIDKGKTENRRESIRNERLSLGTRAGK